MCFMVLYRVLTPQGCVDQGEVDHIKDVGNSYSGVTSSQGAREQGEAHRIEEVGKGYWGVNSPQ